MVSGVGGDGRKHYTHMVKSGESLAWRVHPKSVASRNPRLRNELCERLGIEVPIFAFTHCRDVVVAVSQAGGLGVLGAVGFNPVGQTVGMIRAVQSSRDVIQEMLTELVDAADRLSGALSEGEEEARG